MKTGNSYIGLTLLCIVFWNGMAISQSEKPKDDYNVVVSLDGSGDYTSIQDAIDGSKSFPYKRVIIFIKNGVYYEKVKVYEWNSHVSLIGEDRDKTIITFDDHFKKINKGRNSTFHTPTLLVEGDHFIAKNLTIENSAGEVGQAIALSVVGDKALIINCRLLGNQDTLYASGKSKQYYKDCYIEGTTDFIFGNATALFDNCIIHSKKDSYITAASTPQGTKFGFVFKNCHLTADDDVHQVYLGRPWRIHAKTVFINCEMDDHILPIGWDNWNKPEAENLILYGEYENTGKGYTPDLRAHWSHQLKRSKAKKYTSANILTSTKNEAKNPWYN